jgi:hypothetical protein
MRDVCYLLRVPRWAQALNHRSLSSSVRKKLSTRTPPRIHPNLHTGGDDPQLDAGTPRESLYNHSPLRASRGEDDKVRCGSPSQIGCSRFGWETRFVNNVSEKLRHRWAALDGGQKMYS